MIESRVFDVDPATGRQRFFHFDDESGDMTIETHEDMSALLEACAARRNDTDERAGWKGDMHWVGSLPPSVYYQLKRQYPDPEEMGRMSLHWLQEHSKFQTRSGRLA
jgi:hypothetical protein